MSSTSILLRCMALLETLADAPEGMPLGRVAAAVGMPKSATHRMLVGLIEAGFVFQLPSREYRLTMRFVTLGFRFLGRTGILEQCQGILDELAAETGELVRMTLLDGRRLVWVAKAQGASGPLRFDPVMGQDVVPFATATGKVWLASLSEPEAFAIARESGLGETTPHGPNVIATAGELARDLRVTRERGYGLVEEEADPGISAIALPIRADRRVVGTVSIAGPTVRLPRERLESWLPSLRRTARLLEGLNPLIRYAQPPEEG